jgi:alpha-glucosidase (family GH31 glycosyl hydrolase)
LDLDAPISKINVHLRGGFIIPMQIPGANLIIGRDNPFTLLVAQSQSGRASGNLFWDDGESIAIQAYNYLEFSLDNTVLTIKIIVGKYTTAAMRLEIIKILGVDNLVTGVKINGASYENFLYNIPDQVCGKI